LLRDRAFLRTQTSSRRRPFIEPGSLEFLKGGGEMGARMRALDWTATPLGTPGQWPQSLKTIVRVMLDSRFAMWMMWGPAGTFFCNDAYLPTVGVKQEWVLGARAHEVWEEIWPDIGPRIDHVLHTGEATFDEGLQLFLRRSGYDEETFHTFSYSPVYDDQDRVAGMLCVVVEETTRVIGERRLRTLRELAALSTHEAASVEAAGRELLRHSRATVPTSRSRRCIWSTPDHGLPASSTATPSVRPGGSRSWSRPTRGLSPRASRWPSPAGRSN
jgi:hypothetical protein